MGHGVAAAVTLQCGAVGAYQIDIVTGLTVFHGNDLPVIKGNKALQAGQPLQQHGFLHDAVSQILKVSLGTFRIAESACQQQCVQFYLRCGNGDDLYYVLVIRILLHGGAAAYTMAVADGIAHHKAIQHRRNQFGF